VNVEITIIYVEEVEHIKVKKLVLMNVLLLKKKYSIILYD
jgi:hypothetical protein